MLLCVGSVAYDVIEIPRREPVEVLGGSATWFCAAASLFTRPSLVAVVGDDFREDDRAFLEHRGVDLAGLERRPGATFRWHGRYHDDMQGRDSLATELGVFAEFRPVIPPDLRAPDVLFLGNIAPDLQGLVLAQAHRAGFVALDTIECWMEPPHRERLLRLLARTDLLFLNDDEVRMLSGERAVMRAARRLLDDFGARAVVVKRGEHGAALFRSESSVPDRGEDPNPPPEATDEQTARSRLDIRLFPAFPIESVVDPTGAGDSFAGGALGYLDRVGRFDRETLCDALAVGTVVASFNVEGFGPRHFDRVTPSAFEARLRRYADMVGFRRDEVLGALSRPPERES